jgi:DNA-binding NtrC family response regulator
VLELEVDAAPPDADLLYEVPRRISGARARGNAAVAVRPLGELEHQLLVAALRQHRGNVPRVARTLGVSRGTVYNMMRKYHVDPSSYRVS